jgi:hypothetical protein
MVESNHNPKTNTMLSLEQHGPPTKAMAELGTVPWMCKHPLLTRQTRRAPLIPDYTSRN